MFFLIAPSGIILVAQQFACVCASMCVFICERVYVYVYVRVYVCVCVCIYMYVCVCVCVCAL
jgi:hypothetical protein